MEAALASLLILLSTALAWKAFAVPRSATVFDLAFVAVGFFFGFGYWLALAGGSFGNIQSPDDEVLVWTYTAAALHLIGLWLVGRSRDRARPILEVAPPPERCSLAVVALAWAFGWTFRVIQVTVFGILPSPPGEEEFVAPYSYMVALTIKTFLMHGCLLWAALAVFSSRVRKTLLPTAILFAELGWFILTSRRDAVLWLVLVLLGVVASGRRVRASVLVVGLLGGVMLTQLVLPIIPAMRAVYSRSIGLRDAVDEVLAHGLSSFKDEERANLSSRPLNLRQFIADIIGAQPLHGAMYGSALWRTVGGAIPSFLLPSKQHVLLAEEAIQEHHGLPLVDTAISWPAVAVADFGVAGCPFYGAALGLLIVALMAVVDRLGRAIPFLGLCLAGAVLHFVFQVEQDPMMLWVAIRSFVLLASPVLVWTALTHRRRW